MLTKHAACKWLVLAWWKLIEKDGPMKYNWEGYAELIQMVQMHGLKLHVVMSFHQCGRNVGDFCSMQPWVLEEISKNPDLVYTDKSGRRNPESFRERFRNYIEVEIQVGMGPCGELRYPSYPESNGTRRFSGIGEISAMKRYYLRSLLQAYAESSVETTNWGTSGPHDAGEYKNLPEDTEFFQERWNRKLLEQGHKLLASAKAIFQGTGAKLSGKVAGIYWHYNTRSNAAELTDGSDSGKGSTQFTYLKMNKRLFAGQNWQQLVEFVKNIKE
ncbi:unnamed protein product [Brassica napus]|uniref:Beta-amylase n=1 Tax=Brassica napus TaxID=3708 RepID=A0A816ZZT4_BRANA|nr:unnamed protein product [Brassica napus]